MTRRLDLAFDVGQSGLRGAVARSDGAATMFRIDGFRPMGSLTEVVTDAVQALATASRVSVFRTVAGGLTSVNGTVPSIEGTFDRLNAGYGVSRLVLSDDAFTSFLGARKLNPGVVVAAGTGLVALGIDAQGRPHRVDGMGPMAGDDGSGWWIGRRGLIAAVSAEDGREEGSPALLRSVKSLYGSTEGILSHIRASESAIAAVAQFAKQVVRAARDGDHVSAAILRDAARHIATAIIAAAAPEYPGAEIRFSIVGGLRGAADLLLPSIVEFACDRGLAALHDEPQGTALDGALLLSGVKQLERFLPLVRQVSAAGPS